MTDLIFPVVEGHEAVVPQISCSATALVWTLQDLHIKSSYGFHAEQQNDTCSLTHGLLDLLELSPEALQLTPIGCMHQCA